MKLGELLSKLTEYQIAINHENLEAEVTGITTNSHEVTEGNIFIGITIRSIRRRIQ